MNRIDSAHPFCGRLFTAKRFAAVVLYLATAGMILFASIEVRGAPFRNLDFESVILPLTPSDEYGRVPINNALPGWSGYIGSTPENLVLYDNFFLNSSGIGLEGPGRLQTIDGSYTAFLEAGFELRNDPNRANASISQFGDVPLDARSFFLKGQLRPTWTENIFSVTFDNQTVAMMPLLTASNYTLYGGDVSAFAGLTAELKITLFHEPAPQPHIMWLDSLTFSSEPIPEPSTVMLLGLGSALLSVIWIQRRLRKSV